ncbi:oligosaccharide flippase family protein [Halopiger goleimassiliensis]|uniref:oligosaccharide flippase family protein n=1 Tax=Halopiger goleimassiliensis TaxID=1293048 RepID=UPI0018A829B6|nr:oligosaccharide flippase family protein [Halopiger goleimassiliensis]
MSIALVGTVIGKLFRYFLQFFIARGLGAGAVGFFAFGLVVLQIGATFARAGFDVAAEKYVSIHESDGDERKLTGAVFSTFLFSIGFAIVTVLVLNIGLELFETGYEAYRPVIRHFSVGIPLLALMMVGMHATRGFKETKYSVYTRDIAQSGLAVTLIAIVSFAVSDLRLVIYSYILSLAVGVVLVVYYLYRLGAFAAYANPVLQSREILTFSLPLLFAGVSSTAASWIDILFLSAFVSPDNVGIYQIAFQTSMLMTTIIYAANMIFPSLIADAYSNGNRTYLRDLYTSITKWTAYVTLFLSLFLVVFSSEILSLFGSEFTAGSSTLIALIGGQVIVASTGPSGFVLKMTEFERLELYNSIGMLVLNAALNYVLIQWYGIFGAAIATTFSLATLNIARLLEAKYYVGVLPYSLDYWKGVAALWPPLLVFLLVSEVLTGIAALVVSGTIGGVTFLAIIYLLGLENRDRVLIEAIEQEEI